MILQAVDGNISSFSFFNKRNIDLVLGFFGLKNDQSEVGGEGISVNFEKTATTCASRRSLNW